MDQPFASLIDRLNAGEWVPTVPPQDLRIALALISTPPATTAAQETPAAKDTAHKSAGFLLDVLAEKCGPQTNPLALAIRALLANAILSLSRARPEAAGTLDDDAIVGAVATIALSAWDLRDPGAILRRLRARHMAEPCSEG